MDEVDGMGGSDRGGIAELIKVMYIYIQIKFLLLSEGSYYINGFFLLYSVLLYLLFLYRYFITLFNLMLLYYFWFYFLFLFWFILLCVAVLGDQNQPDSNYLHMQ